MVYTFTPASQALYPSSLKIKFKFTFLISMAESEGLDEMQHCVAFHLSLHCQCIYGQGPKAIPSLQKSLDFNVFTRAS